MKQSIVAVVRPNLNFAQPENQVAHLIEHILVGPKRLAAMGVTDDFYAKNIIFHSGSVGDFFMTEYYVVRSESAKEMIALLSIHQNKLYIDSEEFEKIKSTVIQEIAESKGEFIDTGEQLAKAIYKKGSPSIRHSWNDYDSIANINCDQAAEIFNKYNTNLLLLNLSFDKYEIGKIPIFEKNLRKDNISQIKLAHPWQSPGSIDNYISVNLPVENDSPVGLLYRRSLTDYRFGLLFDELRNKNGLVYDISVYVDHDDNSLEFFFTSNEEKSETVTALILSSLEKYELFIKNNLAHQKSRLSLEIGLDWGDIQNEASRFIDWAISGQMRQSPVSYIKKINTITADDLIKYNNLILNKIKNNSTYIARVHGKKLTTKIVPKSTDLR